MLESFATVVPTLRGSRLGTLRPAAQARYGAVLLEERMTREPALARVYDELELYLQAAGITSLRLRREPSSDAAALFEVLAGVTTLRTLGIERILVVASGEAPVSSVAAASAARESFLEVVVERASGTPEVAHTIHGLIATVRQVADSLVGVATVASPSQTPVARPALRVLSSPEEPPDAPRQDAGVAPPGALALPHRLNVPLLGGAAETVAAISALYTWAVAIVRAEGRAAVDDAAADSPRATRTPTHALWQEAEQWLDERWLAIVDAFATRAPERAEQARALLRRGDGDTFDSSMRAARLAWPYLDGQARQQWLTACSQVFASIADCAGILARRQIDLPAHG